MKKICCSKFCGFILRIQCLRVRPALEKSLSPIFNFKGRKWVSIHASWLITSIRLLLLTPWASDKISIPFDSILILPMIRPWIYWPSVQWEGELFKLKYNYRWFEWLQVNKVLKFPFWAIYLALGGYFSNTASDTLSFAIEISLFLNTFVNESKCFI